MRRARPRKRMSMKDILGMATRRKWRWDYIPAITITYLRSVCLLDSIMLYLMGGTASRVWHDIRGRVNIYPVRFLKCPDLQWPLCCPLHIYCRPSNSYPDTLLSSSASNLVSIARIPRPRILRLASHVPSIRFQRRLNDQARPDRRSNEIERVKRQ